MLANRAPYRRQWQRHTRRHSPGDLHRGAIAQVLAQYLWDAGEVAETDENLPRRLKDLVGRAVTGRVLAPATLRLFVSGFAMTDDDATALWSLLSGRDPAHLSVVRDDIDLVAVEAPRRPRHQTLSLHELHTIGPDGLPESHRTVHVLRAIEEMDRYPYVFDTDAAAVDVLRGGRAGPMYRLPQHGMFGVDLVLHQPLQPGDTASLEYSTLFSYRTPPPREFRRGTLQRLDNVEVHVQFHPEKLPARLWWAVWDDHAQPHPTRREPVNLGTDNAVHRYLDSLSGYTVGFQWDWT